MIKVTKLENGITVASDYMSNVETVSLHINVKVGSRNETQELNGISHLIEHMMFKGTAKRNARRIAEDIDRIGGQMNAFTGKEATCYYVKTIGTNLQKGAEVILDMLTGSLFDKIEMGKERKVICEEIKMIQDQPDDLAHDTVTELLFKGDPLGKSIIGTPTSLKGISRNVLTEYKEKEYTRDAVVVSVAGNFDENEFCKFLEDKFEVLRKTKEKKQYEQTEYKRSFKVMTKDIQQSHICLATKGLDLGDDRRYALNILNNIMGGSMSSRLFQNIREQKGLAYSVYSVASSFSHDGYYLIYAGVGHDKIRHALEGIQEELEVLRSGSVTEDEFSMSKEQMKSSFIFGQENVASRMFANGKNLTLLDKVYTTEEIIDAIDRVSLADIDEIKMLICDPDTYTGVAVTDKRFDWSKIWK